eukprot:scaffold83675_cov19-Tisochrysis_lutea.AAC.1
MGNASKEPLRLCASTTSTLPDAQTNLECKLRARSGQHFFVVNVAKNWLHTCGTVMEHDETEQCACSRSKVS